MNKNLCNIPSCRNYGRYCRIHLVETIKPIAKPKKESDGMKEVMKEYRNEARKFITAHPKCQVCGKPSECIHHKKGRIGENLMNRKTWIAVCIPCHSTIEANPAEAKANNYSESRLIKTS